MPNPESGTVTTDINKAVKESKSGKIEYRVDSAGIVHVAIGKVSFDNDKLLENFNAVLKSLKAAKPSSVKGTYIKNMHLSTSMGPSIQIDTSSLS
jgi:large subunit ribosomal protein L1